VGRGDDRCDHRDRRPQLVAPDSTANGDLTVTIAAPGGIAFDPQAANLPVKP
jgi:hypothetical protein